MSIEQEMKMLVDELNYHTKLYDSGCSIWSDKEWDDHYFHLLECEKKCGYSLPDSPTSHINFQIVNSLEKVKHNHPMLSLQKTKDIEEVKSFIGDKDYVAMAKMDGLTCSLRYVDGKLVSAETRGDGTIGENVLHNALVIPSIPKTINHKDSEVIVDGEIICTKDNFISFMDDFKNPRNFAAGSIRLLDSQECFKRHLTFVAWDMITPAADSLLDKFYFLNSFGFKVVPYCAYNDVNRDIEEIKSMSSNYPIDGVVFKFDNCAYYESLGATDHHFRGGLAFKFYDESESTTLQNIEWSMGRTGQLTPVAIFDPVSIDGTEVSRASLHNVSIMYQTFHNMLGWVGQKVSVAKMNMIIPQIVDSELWDESKETECDYLEIPTICPICGEPLEIVTSDSGTRNLVCGNPSCAGKFVNQLDHYCGKKGFDIKGLSIMTLEKLIDWGWVNNFSDIYTLKNHKNEWITKSGFGEKSVSKILDAIENSQYNNCTLDKVIAAFGIPLIGRTVAKDLIKHFTTYEEFKDAINQNFDFSSLDGYGYEMNKALHSFDYSEMDSIVENFLKISYNTIKEIKESSNESLDGMSIVITGKVNLFKNRDALKEEIESRGGKVASAVSRKTNYLINNDTESTTSKNKTAKEYGVPIISEKEFFEKFLK